MFKKVTIGLALIAVILLLVGFIGTYQDNVVQPAKSPFTVFVPPEMLTTFINASTNYDLVSIVISPDQTGYLITLKNRSPICGDVAVG